MEVKIPKDNKCLVLQSIMFTTVKIPKDNVSLVLPSIHVCHCIRSLVRERAAFRLPTMWPVSCRRLLSRERLESKEFQFIDEIVIS